MIWTILYHHEVEEDLESIGPFAALLAPAKLGPTFFRKSDPPGRKRGKEFPFLRRTRLESVF
jgi:hypothetical protein